MKCSICGMNINNEETYRAYPIREEEDECCKRCYVSFVMFSTKYATQRHKKYLKMNYEDLAEYFQINQQKDFIDYLVSEGGSENV